MKKLGFGLMRLPLQEAGDPKKIDQETLNRMTDRFLAEGFTYFDTAYPYHQGMSERAVKKALTDRYPRESFLLADKMIVGCVQQQLDAIVCVNKCDLDGSDNEVADTAFI